jgi:hypothetical protein
MAGPVYRYSAALVSDRKWPAYYDGEASPRNRPTPSTGQILAPIGDLPSSFMVPRRNQSRPLWHSPSVAPTRRPLVDQGVDPVIGDGGRVRWPLIDGVRGEAQTAGWGHFPGFSPLGTKTPASDGHLSPSFRGQGTSDRHLRGS